MQEKTARCPIAVIGMGAVGQALYQVASEHHDVVGYDIVGDYDWKRVLESRAAIVCVGTPAGRRGRLNVQSVLDCIEALDRSGYAGLAIIKSTLSLGTMANLRARHPDVRLVYMPEFLRERSAVEWTRVPDRFVVAGTSADCAEAREIFGWSAAPTLRMSDEAAELGKLAHNAYIAQKVSFANQIGKACQRLGVDAHDVMSVIHHDRRVGNAEHLRPTMEPFGGKCVPKDSRDLLATCPELSLLEEALQFNAELEVSVRVAPSQ